MALYVHQIACCVIVSNNVTDLELGKQLHHVLAMNQISFGLSFLTKVTIYDLCRPVDCRDVFSLRIVWAVRLKRSMQSTGRQMRACAVQGMPIHARIHGVESCTKVTI